jgi:3-hydroxyacyl-[acyl-carrier-protein] dehydratase
MLNINEIMSIIPHRYPFLLIDRIIEVVEGKKAIGIKNVSANEPFFAGHFPGHPVMPGVLILEALAQVGAVAVLSLPENKGKLALFAGIDEARFRKQVVPGDILRLETEMERMRSGIGKAKAAAYVGDELVCEAKLMFAIQ